MSVFVRPSGYSIDTPTITIAAATATSTSIQTSHAREIQVQFAWGTISGSYTVATVQAKTSYDGVNFLTFGTAVSVTVASSTVSAWTLIEQLGTTSVTTSTASGTVALGLGQLTQFVFAASSYGTSAPVTITTIAK